MSEFSIGQRVRVKNGVDGGSYYKSGDVGTISEKSESGRFFWVQFDEPCHLDGEWLVRSSELEAIE